MLTRFILCWAVLACFLSFAMWLAACPFDPRMLPSIAFFTALVAAMVAVPGSGGTPADRHGLKRW